MVPRQGHHHPGKSEHLVRRVMASGKLSTVSELPVAAQKATDVPWQETVGGFFLKTLTVPAQESCPRGMEGESRKSSHSSWDMSAAISVGN